MAGTLLLDPDGIRRLLNSPNPDFPTILNHTAFFGLWNIRDRQVVSFVVSHIDDIIDHAFQLRAPVDRHLTQRSRNILATPVPLLQQQLLSQPKLVNFLLNSFTQIQKFPAEAQAAFFGVLLQCPGIVFDRQWTIAPPFARDEFVAEFFRHLDIDGAFSLVLRLVTTGPKPVLPFLRRAHFCRILVDNILTAGPIVAHRSQQLFMEALTNRTAVDVPAVLLEEGGLSVIVHKSTKDAQSLDFLKSLVDYGAQFTFSVSWRRVGSEVASRLPLFCRVVCEQQSFTKLCHSSVRLAAAIFGGQRAISDDVRRMLLRLGDWFFEFPTNSFLHNQFVDLMAAVDAAHTLSADLVKEMRLCERIVDAYRNREKDQLSCYWGQLFRLADLINPYTEKAGADLQVWRKEVIARNAETRRVVAEGYGGWKPRVAVKKWNRDLYCVLLAFLLFLVSALLVTAPKISRK
jgi:hypothetical protein